MNFTDRHITSAALWLLLAGGSAACAGARTGPKEPQGAAAVHTTPTQTSSPEVSSAPSSSPRPQEGYSPNRTTPRTDAAGEQERPEPEDDEAELVVSKELVARCPTVRLVRAHLREFDADMVWLAVLVAIADCMGAGGTMAERNIAVSGDEAHRHVIRQVLGSRGVAPTRVVAQPAPSGSAECQRGMNCNKQVVITIAAY